MGMNMLLYVVRHGQSDVNVGSWAEIDTMDASLTNKGHQQAAALRDWLVENGQRADILYASTMRRTQETARYLEEAFEMRAITDDRIRELGNSALDGTALPEATLPRQFNARKAHTNPFINRGVDVVKGESWMHFRTRIGQFTDDLLDKHLGQTVYVVAHGGVMSALFDNIYNVGPYRRARSHTDNTGWSCFEYRADGSREHWEVYHHNRIDHLLNNNLR